MISKGEAAIRAAGHITAYGTLQRGGVATPIQEENDLLVAFQALGNAFFELRRKNRHTPFALGLAHVHDANERHFFVIGALGQVQQGVFAFAAIVKAFQRRSG